MTRAIFSHETVDPDFQWLLSNYVERKGGVMTVDVAGLPVVLVLLEERERAKLGTLEQPLPPAPIPQDVNPSERDETPSE
jgi:hypothetical protein